MKYFVLGAIASGALLYGISWVYGITGTRDFDGDCGQRWLRTRASTVCRCGSGWRS